MRALVAVGVVTGLMLLACAGLTGSTGEGGEASPLSFGGGSAGSATSSGGGGNDAVVASGGSSSSSSGGNASTVTAADARVDCSVTDGGPVNGPDCVTAEITCGQTLIGHTKGGVNLYDTKFYESNTCWPGTRNHNGGDERVYMFVADESPRFKAGEDRQRITVSFDSPCADLSFTKMVGSRNRCPRGTAKYCDTENPFNRDKGTMNIMNVTVDRGEVLYFLVEGGDDAEGAFSVHLECGT